MKSQYYVQILNNHLNLITIFLLYDLEKNLIYFGEDKIGDVSMPIFNPDKIRAQKIIPISKGCFEKFLDLSLKKLNKTNKNIFLAFNCLEEWNQKLGKDPEFYKTPTFVVGNDIFIWLYFTKNDNDLCFVTSGKGTKCVSHQGSATEIDNENDEVVM